MSNNIEGVVNSNTDQNKCSIEDLLKNYDTLYQSIITEFNSYKTDHQLLRTEVHNIIQLKEHLNTNPTANKAEFHSDLDNTDALNFKRVTDGAILNLRDQLKLLKQEKDTCEDLWRNSQKTVANLENEIAEYRNQFKGSPSMIEIKREYGNIIKQLEAKFQTTRDELQRQIQLNENLQKEKNSLTEKCLSLENKLKDINSFRFDTTKRIESIDTKLLSTEKQLIKTMHERNELEEKLTNLSGTVMEYKHRESELLRRFEESLQLVEMATAEKNRAILRESSIRDESNHLASTIGEILEEAANKVDKDFDQNKNKYMQKIKLMSIEINRMKAYNELQSKQLITAENRGLLFEKQLAAVIQNNRNLDLDLQTASKAIIEMELKLDASEKLIKEQQEATRRCQEKTLELQNYFENNKKIKERWKKTVTEMTARLQKEITVLQNQNQVLRKERDFYKSQHQ